MKKILIAMLLIATLVCTLVACGGGGNTGDNTGNNNDVVDGPGDSTGGNDDETGGGTPVTPTPGERANPTVINIQGYEAGVNLNWLRTLCAEFEEIHKHFLHRRSISYHLIGNTGKLNDISGNRHTRVNK